MALHRYVEGTRSRRRQQKTWMDNIWQEKRKKTYENIIRKWTEYIEHFKDVNRFCSYRMSLNNGLNKIYGKI